MHTYAWLVCASRASHANEGRIFFSAPECVKDARGGALLWPPLLSRDGHL